MEPSEIEIHPNPKESIASSSNSGNNSDGLTQTYPSFSHEVWERVIAFIDSHRDRNSASAVCKDWYNSERWTRTKLYIGNCYIVSPETVATRFPNIKSITVRGSPIASEFVFVPQDWVLNIHPWLEMFAQAYPFLEELRLRKMTITDKNLEFLAKSFPSLKALSLGTCAGFGDNGLKHIAMQCGNLTELDIQNCITEQVVIGFTDEGCWVSCFPENFASLELLNFSGMNSLISFDTLERLVSRCKSLTVLKVNGNVENPERLLIRVPHLLELTTDHGVWRR